METWDAIRARRNVRTFEDRPIPSDDLDRILEAGRRSPSSRNWQPWDFVVVTDRERLQELAKVWRGAGHVVTSAATIAFVAPNPDDEFAQRWLGYDLGQATMQMMLAAADLGIGTAHAAAEDQDLAREILGHPSDKHLSHLMSLGYPADRPLRPVERPDRRPFGDVVHRETWRGT